MKVYRSLIMMINEVKKADKVLCSLILLQTIAYYTIFIKSQEGKCNYCYFSKLTARS